MQNTTDRSNRLNPAKIDLRHRAFRERAEDQVALAEWLHPTERALIESVFDRGMTVSQLALMSGDDPRLLQRRLRRLLRRMNSREFREVIRRADTWPVTRRRVAQACILQGLTLRGAAEQLRLSIHTVREQLAIIRAVINGGEDPDANPSLSEPRGPSRDLSMFGARSRH